MVPSLPLLSCESSVSVKENPDRKYIYIYTYIYIYIYSLPYGLHQKIFSPNSAIRKTQVCQGFSKWGSFARTETVLISSCFTKAWAEITAFRITDSLLVKLRIFGVLQAAAAFYEGAYNHNDKWSFLASNLIAITSILIPSQGLKCSWKPVA